MPNQFNFDEDLGSSHSRADETEDVDRLIFPINVHESLKASGGLKKGEKTGIIISFWLFGCGVLGWLLMSWLRGIFPNHYFLITIIIEVVLQLTVGVYILRFVLDERAMFREIEGKNMSFAQYFKIYKEIVAGDGTPLPFDVLEYDDGSWGAFLQLRLGFNTNLRSDNTYHANKELVEILNKAGLARKTFYHNEPFKFSKAADDLRDILKGIKDPQLFTAYREVVQNYLDIAEDQGNVICCTHIIYAQTRIQKDEFLATMNSVMAALTRPETVYREIEFLKYEGIVEFLRTAYKLDVVDMGLVRVNTTLNRKSYTSNSLHVLRIYGKSGKVYTNKEFGQLRSDILKQQGVESLK